MASKQIQIPKLGPNLSGGGALHPIGSNAWRLEIPSGKAGTYRLAQLDDYGGMKRERFPWNPPLELHLEARASGSGALPGTWGFGLWNDPFSLSLGMGGGTRHLPALPNCTWFFFASPENYLSLRDDLPPNGALAAAFRSPNLPAPLIAAGGLSLTLLAVPFLRKWLRRAAGAFVQQEARRMEHDPSSWHAYRINWELEWVSFFVDEKPILTKSISPIGPLGLVLWVDNQYAALPPNGRPRYGTLANPEPVWIEVRSVEVRS